MSISLRFPASNGGALVLLGVLLAVAPLTQAFEIVERVVERIAVAVMDLALPGFAAAFAGPFRFQSVRAAASGATSFRHPCGVSRLTFALAFRTAEPDGLEHVAGSSARLRVGRILMLRRHRDAAYFTWLGLLSVGHFSASLSAMSYLLETMS